MKDINNKLYIGPAGWSYQDWQGVVYPQKQERSFYALEYLMRFFNTIEINSTFYHIPRRAVVQKWVRTAKNHPGFLFTAKLWQKFTHDRQWDNSDSTAFKNALFPMLDQQRLGALLVQFPWSFKYSESSMIYLKKLADRFSEFPLAVEFRHKNWNRPQVLDVFREHHIAFVNIDQPLLHACLGRTANLTSSIGYIRFHGRNQQHWFNEKSGRNQRYNYLYDPSDLCDWQRSIKAIAAQSTQTFVVFNNHFRGQAVVNAFQIAALLNQEKSAVPAHLIKAFPQLKEISAQQKGQSSLDLF